MPFPGIPTGSALERRIDRCVERVVVTGRDKSAAIAICRSSIEKKSDNESNTTKTRADAIERAAYRPVGAASTQVCETCRFGANEARLCDLFDFVYDPAHVCNEWLPNIEATRQRLQELQAANKERHKRRAAWVRVAAARVALKKERIHG
jgi:hypothetical protein